MTPFVIPSAAGQLTDDVLRHELVEWSCFLHDENRDLTPAQWAAIDELLDELGRRLALEALEASP